MAQSRAWDVDRVSRNQPTTWSILVHWIKIERLWLNGEENGAGDRVPDGASPEIRRRCSGLPLQRREGIGELDKDVVKLTRGSGSSMKLGKTIVDGGRRRWVLELTGDGARGLETQPEAVGDAPRGSAEVIRGQFGR